MPTDIGIIDLGIGFPYQSVEEKKAAYDFFRPLLKDRQSREEFEFPARVHVQGRPRRRRPRRGPGRVDRRQDGRVRHRAGHGRPVGPTASGPSGSTPAGSTSCAASIRTGASRRCARSSGEGRARHRRRVSLPVGHVPRSPINDKKMYPIYMKCVELDLPICINGGIVGPRMPSWPQHVERLRRGPLRLPRAHHGDDARRRAVDGAGREADAEVARPALHDERVRPEALPEATSSTLRQHPRRRQDHVLRLLPCRAHARAPVQRPPQRPVQRRRLAEVPAENAIRVFQLDGPNA